MDRSFIKKLPELSNSLQRASRLSTSKVRKWSVRKLRRRPKSCDNSKRDNKKVVTTDNKKCDDSNAQSKDDSNILLFGSDLDKQALDSSFSLSSDQESTGGEEEEVVGII